MKPGQVLKAELPEGSRILSAQAGADFADSYHFASAQPEATALQQYLALSARTPAWMNALMQLRNQAVRWVGLKNLGAMGPGLTHKPAASYRPGDRVGIFTLQYVDEREVILEDRDKHLHVQVSLFRRDDLDLQMSTVVHIHNRLGRAYMAVVGPVHGLIVPLMLKQVSDVR